MYKYGDYSAYINSLKGRKTFNGNYTTTSSTSNTSNTSSTNGPNSVNGLAFDNRNNFESLFTDKSFYCTPVMIRHEKQITYIEPPIDKTSEGDNRNYILQSSNTIPNGTFKTIVNNIDVSKGKNSSVTLTTENSGGFAIFNKRYTKYKFVYLGEDFQLLWNSSLSAWTVLKYNGLFE